MAVFISACLPLAGGLQLCLEAGAVDCHITVKLDMVKKLSVVGYDPCDDLLDTEGMFRNEATQAGFAS